MTMLYILFSSFIMYFLCLGKFSKKKKNPLERVSPERKQWVRKESAMILARSIMLREEAKQNMFEERAIRDERVSVGNMSCWKKICRSLSSCHSLCVGCL